MSDLRGVVVSHGGVAAALVDAVRQITGEGDALEPVSNTDCSGPALGRLVAEAVGEGPAVVFVDLAGGSCLLGALGALRGRTDVAVVAGVNLPMLIDFVYQREGSPAAAAERAAGKGAEAIRAFPCP